MTRELHPIVAQLTPNAEQRPAVSARGSDVVVTAGAGTGKTRTLVARYLSLLAEDRPLRTIVAITFTRKAAREMRNRVRAEVRRYLARENLTSEQREHWRAIYADLDAARIGTIHSLCTEMLRAHPAEAGVDPRFQVLEEGRAALMRRQVLDACLAWAADEPDAAELFMLLNGPVALRDVIRVLLERRLDAAGAFDEVPGDPLPVWRETLRQRKRRRLDALTQGPAWVDAVATLRASKPMDPDDRMAVQRRRALAAIDEARRCPSADPAEGGEPGSTERAGDALDERFRLLSGLGEISLVGGSYRAWPGGKAEKAAVKEALRALRKLWCDHADFLSLETTPLDERLAEVMDGLEALFRYGCQRYRAAKRDERVLDFDDLESGALDLLRHHREVRDRWQWMVEAILVDEFQDTNERQRDLVHLLADGPGGWGGKLFIVGDAKQSIYRFRGADVTVFRTEREGITGRGEAGGGEGWELTTSYRAHRGLVQALNDLLRPMLGEEDDPDRPWAEPFAPIEPYREAPRAEIEPPYVELHLTVGSKSDGGLDRAARALVARLSEMVESGGSVRDGEDAGPPTYGDVTILCRASTSFSPYEDALDEAGIPYVTVAGRGFYDRPEIRDLLNGLRAVSDPTDDLALAGLLRSPAFALSDEAIYRLVSARSDGDGPGEGVGPLWDVLRRGGAGLDDVARRRAERAASTVRRLHAMVGRMDVCDLLKAFLDETAYRAVLLGAGDQRGVRNVDKLLHDAHASGLVSVGAFLDYVQGLRDSGAREGEARAVAGGAVQIMTVHQAKGLEFPVVVLGDATWSGGGGGKGVLVDPALGVLLPVKDREEDERAAIYRLAQAREADRDAAESDRLLYVAATRAKEKLLVSGCLRGIRKDGTPHKLHGWLGKLGRPLGLDEVEIAYDDQGDVAHYRSLRVGETSVDCFIYEPECRFAAAATARDPRGVKESGAHQGPLPPPLLMPVADRERVEGEGKAPQRLWRVVPEVERPRAPAWLVGKLVHEALAAWRLPGTEKTAAFGDWVRARARAQGLIDGGQITHALRRSRRLLLRLQENALFEEIETAERRLHEVPFSVERDGRIDSGQIDLLYLTDGVWTMVELKTDRVRNREHFEAVLREKAYVDQARRYADAAEELLGRRPRCLLWMLDYGRGTRVYSVPAAGLLQCTHG